MNTGLGFDRPRRADLLGLELFFRDGRSRHSLSRSFRGRRHHLRRHARLGLEVRTSPSVGHGALAHGNTGAGGAGAKQIS